MFRPVLICTLAAFALAAPAHAQQEDSQFEQSSEHSAIEWRSEQVVGVLNGEIEAEDVFADSFLTAVSPQQLAAISQQLTSQFGHAISVESVAPPTGTRAALAIRMERAIARGGIAIDPTAENRISELLFQTFDSLDDTPEKIASDLDTLPGNVSYWFGPLDGDAVLSSDEDPQMALGSTFKLYVLAALAREVRDGRMRWSDTVALGDPRSFPSGMMQDWPEDAPVTLHTLASMMISISDNTATDVLMRHLGQERLRQTIVDSGHSDPELNAPFLTTRQMFLLKGGPADRLAAFQGADASAREAILAAIEDHAVDLDAIRATFSGGPVALDVEWFANAADLRSLLRFMRESADEEAFAIMQINPSLAGNARENWPYAGYKGGSEPGVLNLTWLLTDQQGRDHALILSWNNPEASLDNTALELIASRILALPQ